MTEKTLALFERARKVCDSGGIKPVKHIRPLGGHSGVLQTEGRIWMDV